MSNNGQATRLDYDSLRGKMIRHLISEGGIKDSKVIEAMRAVPRHLFVEESLRGQAYEDHALPIGYDQTISQPYIVAKMTELLELSPEDKVLEIGMGSGYQTAILAKIAHQVFAIERIPELAQAAEALLKQLGFENVRIRVGDGTQGWPEEPPFNGIIVAACAARVPEVLVEQLAVGGRLIIPIGGKQSQRLIRLRKGSHENKVEDHGGCVFVRLIGKYGWSN